MALLIVLLIIFAFIYPTFGGFLLVVALLIYEPQLIWLIGIVFVISLSTSSKPIQLVWRGKMSCGVCNYIWTSRRMYPPARCANCRSTNISIVEEPYKGNGNLFFSTTTPRALKIGTRLKIIKNFEYIEEDYIGEFARVCGAGISKEAPYRVRVEKTGRELYISADQAVLAREDPVEVVAEATEIKGASISRKESRIIKNKEGMLVLVDKKRALK